jgi:hypothetical protein
MSRREELEERYGNEAQERRIEENKSAYARRNKISLDLLEELERIAEETGQTLDELLKGKDS